ncbi:MAG: aminopeptidase P family protein [Desulfobacteraceae bacterium]|nr:aminopeptidase P family protein [Desulfobacteraceae bacterium]
MKTHIKDRIEKLKNSFPDACIDTLLVQVGENRRYLSGFTGEDTGFDESAGVLLISDKGLVLATDSRFEIQAQNEAHGFEVICYKKGLSKELPAILEKLDTKLLGFETRRMTCEQYDMICGQLAETGSEKVELVKIRGLTESLRRCKEESEIDKIRESLHLAESAFSGLLENIVPGMTEAWVAWEIEKRMREAGAESISFPPIVAFGKNAALPHAIPSKDTIKQGIPLLFDWGARLDGYCSDISRTIIMGKSDDTYARVFTAVYEAQQKAIDAVRPGAWTKEIDAAARDHLREKGLDQYFGHGLGHGVGLAIHEGPSLSPVEERNVRVEENMVFTIEPGVYLPDWGGIRLENMVAVRSCGAEVLNSLEVKL